MFLPPLLTFSDRLWYPLYDPVAAPWGLTALEDQQLAGLIMWVPGGLAYPAAALAVVASWLRQPARAVALQRQIGGNLLLALLVVLAAADAATALLSLTIDGIPGANGTVGPVLNGIAGRPYIAGVLTNSPGNLTRWIQHPQQIDSLTAMPDVGLSDSTARDIVSYLLYAQIRTDMLGGGPSRRSQAR